MLYRTLYPTDENIFLHIYYFDKDITRITVVQKRALYEVENLYWMFWQYNQYIWTRQILAEGFSLEFTSFTITFSTGWIPV